MVLEFVEYVFRCVACNKTIVALKESRKRIEIEKTKEGCKLEKTKWKEWECLSCFKERHGIIR